MKTWALATLMRFVDGHWRAQRKIPPREYFWMYEVKERGSGRKALSARVGLALEGISLASPRAHRATHSGGAQVAPAAAERPPAPGVKPRRHQTTVQRMSEAASKVASKVASGVGSGHHGEGGFLRRLTGGRSSNHTSRAGSKTGSGGGARTWHGEGRAQVASKLRDTFRRAGSGHSRRSRRSSADKSHYATEPIAPGHPATLAAALVVAPNMECAEHLGERACLVAALVAPSLARYMYPHTFALVYIAFYPCFLCAAGPRTETQVPGGSFR